jgi:FkbM family methyltransferase
MEDDLIYDVGMHNGDDTAYYLHRGYRVLAIEADPDQAEAGRRRFSSAIAAGRLTVLNVAISAERGMVPFWISSNAEFSSLDRTSASGGGHFCRSIEVPSRPFADVLTEYGVPYYLKVDIEGADHLCLEAIDRACPPRYVSFEKWHLNHLMIARDREYMRFKLVAQGHFRQFIFQPGDGRASSLLPLRLRRWSRRVSGRLRAAKDRRRHGADWEFSSASSGPFGEETDGSWRTFEEVAFTWLAFDLGHTRAQDPECEDWFDVHCTI